MSTSVAIEEMDLVVLGQVQYSFALSKADPTGQVVTTGGYSLDGVLVPCCAQRAVAVDQEVKALSEEVRQRARKLEALGTALSGSAYILGALATVKNAKETSVYPTDVGKSFQRSDVLPAIRDAIKPYDLTYQKYKDGKPDGTGKLVDLVSKDTITMSDTRIVQTTLQLATDKENNALKQTNNSLTSFIRKRDSAYELIGKLSRKIIKTEGTTIRALGR